MDYGWINSQTECMRTLQPPLGSAPGASSAGQISQGLMLQCRRSWMWLQGGGLGEAEMMGIEGPSHGAAAAH